MGVWGSSLWGVQSKRSSWVRREGGVYRVAVGGQPHAAGLAGELRAERVRGAARRYARGAPPIVASGRRSIEYLWLWMYMMGTPGILRMRRRRSRSQVATM